MESATKVVKPLGRIIQKTTCSPASRNVSYVNISNSIVVKELVVIGSRCGPFREALNLLIRNLAVVKPVLSQMITASYPLEEIETALNKAGERGVLKVQIEFPNNCLV